MYIIYYLGNCSCTDSISIDGYGNCLKEYPLAKYPMDKKSSMGVFCFVYEPSTCFDMDIWNLTYAHLDNDPRPRYSWQACDNQG